MNGCQDSIPYASCCNLKMSKAETFRGGFLQFGPHHQLLVHIILSVTYNQLLQHWDCFGLHLPYPGHPYVSRVSINLFWGWWWGVLSSFFYFLTVLFKHPDLLVFCTKQWKHCWKNHARINYLLSSPGVSESFKSFLFNKSVILSESSEHYKVVLDLKRYDLAEMEGRGEI